jgi:hypothetical protein
MDCGLWFFEQAQATYRYVTAVHQKDALAQDQAARRMVANADSWGRLTQLPAAGDLMKFHVGAIKRLADSAFSRHKRGMEIGLEEAIANEQAQTKLYLKSFSRFPEKEWSDAFTLYITAVAGYTLALAGGDLADFRRQSEISREAKNALAALWADVVDANGLK